MCFTSYRSWSTSLCFFVCANVLHHAQKVVLVDIPLTFSLSFSLYPMTKNTHIWLYNAHHPAPLRLGDVGEPGLDHRLGVGAVELNHYVTVSVL